MATRQLRHASGHRVARFVVAVRRRGRLLQLHELPRHQRGGLRPHRRFERETLGPRHLRPLGQHQHDQRDADGSGDHRGREREAREHHLPADGLVRRLGHARGRRGVAQRTHRPQGLRGSGACGRRVRRLHQRRQHQRRAADVEHDRRQRLQLRRKDHPSAAWSRASMSARARS